MIFDPLPLAGCYRLTPEEARDRRGFFTRGYARTALEGRDLDPAIVHCEVAIHHKQGTRYAPSCRSYPPGEAVLARCTLGAVHALAVDLRPESATFERVFDTVLDKAHRQALYLAPGVAFGFQTLDEETEVLIQRGELDDPDAMQIIPAQNEAVRAAWPPLAHSVRSA